MLFITSNQEIPDETASTIWGVTARVYLEVHDVDSLGSLTLQASTDENKIISSAPLKLDRSTDVLYFDVSLEVFVRNTHSTLLNDAGLSNFRFLFVGRSSQTLVAKWIWCSTSLQL